MSDLSPDAAHAAWRAGDLTIIDVREADEYTTTHVAGMALIPMSELAERVDDIPADGPLAILCRSGARSGRVADFLTANGEHGDVANVEGGILAWAAAGLPYEGEPPA